MSASYAVFIEDQSVNLTPDLGSQIAAENAAQAISKIATEVVVEVWRFPARDEKEFTGKVTARYRSGNPHTGGAQ